MDAAWRKISKESEFSKLSFMVAIIGYSLFIAANTFTLREPDILFETKGAMDAIAMRDLTYLPFALASFAIGIVVLKLLGQSSLQKLILIAASFFVLGMLFWFGSSFLGIAIFALPASMVCLAIYSAVMFADWIRVAMHMTRGQVWLFAIVTSILASVVHFALFAFTEVFSPMLLFCVLSFSSLGCLGLRRFRFCGEQYIASSLDQERSTIRCTFGKHASTLLALGTLGFVSASARMTLSEEMTSRFAVGGIIAVLIAGLALFFIVFVLKKQVDIQKIILASVPCLAAICLALPFVSHFIQLIMLTLSTGCFTTGLLMLQVLSKDYGAGNVRISVGAFSFFSGCVYLITMLGYQIPFVSLANKLNTQPEIISSMLCLVVLVIGLSVVCLNHETPSLPAVDPIDAAVRAVSGECGLSPKESEVLLLMANGRDVPFIAKYLVVSQSTVRTHNKHIFKKMNVHSRQECIDEVMRHRL